MFQRRMQPPEVFLEILQNSKGESPCPLRCSYSTRYADRQDDLAASIPSNCKESMPVASLF